MAWLIALALLLWIGSAIFSAADKAQHRAQEQRQIRDDELKAVKGNIYTIAWQHCLDLQLEYLKESPIIPSNETLPYHYTMTHGASLQKLSVIYALEDLRSRNQLVIRIINGDARIVQPTEHYDVQAEASVAHTFSESKMSGRTRHSVACANCQTYRCAQDIFARFGNANASVLVFSEGNWVLFINPISRKFHPVSHSPFV